MKGIHRAGLFCGIVAPWWWAAIIVICAALWPHYDHTQQFISELGAHGSPTQTLMVWAGFYLTGVLYLLFGITLMAMDDTRDTYRRVAAILIVIAGMARLGTGFFPCEAGCAAVEGSIDHTWHHIFARIGYGALTLAAMAWTAYSWFNNSRRFAAYSLATFVVALFLLNLLQNSIEPRADTGLYQRLVTLVLSSWIFVLATVQMRLATNPRSGNIGQQAYR
jgi:hypothetical membrane protein